MKELPILMNTDVVKNVLAGLQTQDRRPMKPQPNVYENGRIEWRGNNWSDWNKFPDIESPFGAVGDRLYVRETWAVGAPFDDLKPSELDQHNDESSMLAVDYKADQHRIWGNTGNCGKTRPSIHMPKWASRITLEVKRVWVERIQEMSEEDARAEGITTVWPFNLDVGGMVNLWDSIYGDKYPWASNPWVWTCEFEMVKS